MIKIIRMGRPFAKRAFWCHNYFLLIFLIIQAKSLLLAGLSMTILFCNGSDHPVHPEGKASCRQGSLCWKCFWSSKWASLLFAMLTKGSLKDLHFFTSTFGQTCSKLSLFKWKTNWQRFKVACCKEVGPCKIFEDNWVCGLQNFFLNVVSSWRVWKRWKSVFNHGRHGL